MTQPHLLEQAKQGDPQAIAHLMNKSLQPKGMTAYVERQGDRLEVVLKADRIPNRQSLSSFVERGIQNLRVRSIKSVRVIGQQIGAVLPAWEQQLFFNYEDSRDFDPVVNLNPPAAVPPTDQLPSGDSTTELAQLQELLSDSSVHAAPDPQRQALENRLESLWVEQSDEAAQDFLAELMADDLPDSGQQFETFLRGQSDDRFQSQEQEGLWMESLPETELLPELNLEDARAALSDRLGEMGQPPDQAFDPARAEFNQTETDDEFNDEPDEVLLNFIDETPLPDQWDEAGEPIDEPDEVLLDFLTAESDNPELSQTLPLTELSNPSLGYSDLPDSDLVGEEELLLDSSDPDHSDNPDLLAALTGSEFANSMNELSLGVDNEPDASQTDDHDEDDLAELPPGFLQEFPETSPGQSEELNDLYVVPQTNPFIEQMQGQDNNQFQPPRAEEDTNTESHLNQFDQTDWVLDESDLDSDQLPPVDESSSQDSDPSDPLSDQALINFFGEEPIDETTGERPISGDRWSYVDDPDRPYPDSEPVVQSEGPDINAAAAWNQEFPGSALMGDQSQLDPYDEFSADAELAASPDRYPDTEIPEPSAANAYPTTEIPEPLPATEIPEPIPAYEEPSQEALEQQLAEFDLENSTAQPADAGDAEVAVAEPRGSSWLFPLILLGISGWIVGLISFAFLWSRLSSPPPVADPVAGASPDAVSSPSVAPTTCPPTANAEDDASIGLTSLQFQPTAANPQQINLIGCITNRTAQPIDLVSIGYRSGSGGNTTVGGLNLPNSLVQPGQTVPFTSKFTLPSETTDVDIETVYWQPAGQTSSREAATSINLNR